MLLKSLGSLGLGRMTSIPKTARRAQPGRLSTVEMPTKRADTSAPGKAKRDHRAQGLQAAEAAAHAAALEQALVLADKAVDYSKRLKSMQDADIPLASQRDLLRALFAQKASGADTVTAHLRNVNRLLDWAQALGRSPWDLSAPRIAMFLQDMAPRL